MRSQFSSSPPARDMQFDNNRSLEEVAGALANAGLESLNPILGFDFTKSNQRAGTETFDGCCLHHIGDAQNPYEHAISILGRLSAFYVDNWSPWFGFGDATTHEQDVFRFYADEKGCNGFEGALTRYREIVPHHLLSGPKSFGPFFDVGKGIVERSSWQYHVLLIVSDGRYGEIVPHHLLSGPKSFGPFFDVGKGIVERSNWLYHVLLIVSDGPFVDGGLMIDDMEVSRSVNTEHGHSSPQEEKTIEAIRQASSYPLSIILVGVGDNPGYKMQAFYNRIQPESPSNFRFVNFTEIMWEHELLSERETKFALSPLNEIQSLYMGKKAVLGEWEGRQHWEGNRVAFRPHLRPRLRPPPATAPPSPPDVQVCQICFTRPKDMAFGCGHQVTEALANAGLESFNLILGIDFTKSNEWTGMETFDGRCLHHIGDAQNPYEQAISVIGRTLYAFYEDNLIACFGFGDATTHDQDVFSFYADEKRCNGFEEALTRYREIVPHLLLSGPTSFAPIIEMAITTVEQSGGEYHVLLIVSDGPVSRSVGTELGHLSPQEKKTVDAVVKASGYPLSIILVGVGDGPWHMMREFDDNIPSRAFDNFQFVNFTEIMSKDVPVAQKESEFALSALMEIPSQYKATIELNILGRRKGKGGDWVALPPPFGIDGGTSCSTKWSKPSHSSGCAKSAWSSNCPPCSPLFPEFSSSMPLSATYFAHAGTALPATASYDNQVCPICCTRPKDMAFGCGHRTCGDCGENLEVCPFCRRQILLRLMLY